MILLRRRFPAIAAALLTAIGALAGTAGCSREAEPATIDRDTFIATWVDLRRAAYQVPTRQLSDTARARILTAHGVSEDDLMTFANVRGADPDYMLGLWTDVSAQLAPDSAAAAGTAPVSQPAGGPLPPSMGSPDTTR